MANKVSSAADFKKVTGEGMIITLPYSKLNVRCRPVSLQGLVRRNIIPQALLTMALQGFPELEKLQKAGAVQTKDAGKVTDMLVKAEQFQFAVISNMVIEPRVVSEPTEGAVMLEDFLDEDIAFLMDLSQTSIKEWERFLPKQGERVPTMEDGEGVSDSSE